MDLETNVGLVIETVMQHDEHIKRSAANKDHRFIPAVVKVHDVEPNLKIEMEYSQFSADNEMQQKLRNLI